MNVPRRLVGSSILGGILVPGALLFLALGFAQEQSTAPDLDPEVRSLLKSLSDRVAALPAFRFRAEITYDEIEVLDRGDGVDSDVKIEYGAQVEITLRRPDAMRVSYHDDVEDREFWYDGEKATLLAPKKGFYGQREISGHVGKALDTLEAQTGFAPPLSDILYPDLYSVLEPSIRGGRYVGMHDVRQIPCHHILVHQEAADCQLWIDAERLLPRKLVITYTELPGAPEFSATWTEWDFDPRLPDDIFAFEAPEGSVRVEILGSEVPGGGK